ncbi:MAG: hypothetical protein U0791_22835 [Gemmataceae bacterium]
MPYPHPSIGADDSKWTAQDNHRRCDLIDKDLDGGLTASEQAELNDLEARLDRHVDALSPLPLEPLRMLHRKLLSGAKDTSP